MIALYFLASMARGLSFFDSPLLAIAAVQAGLAHPPGQPLYTILGTLFAHLPGVPALVGLNALSALAGALTVLPALSLAEAMRARSDDLSLGAHLALSAALVIGAMHVALWEQSTRIEVYALAAFLSMWCLARLAFVLADASHAKGALIGLGVGVGLAASVNPVLCAFAVLSGTPAAFSQLARKRLHVRDVLFLGLGALLGLLPYLYVFWAGRRTDVLVWGAPRDTASLLHYFTGKDFTTNLEVSTDQWITQFFAWIAWSYDRTLLPILALGVTGQLVSPPRGIGRFSALTAFVLAAAYLSHYAVWKPDVPDYVSYASFASWLSLSGVAGLVGALFTRGQRAIALSLLSIPLACVLISSPAPWARTRSADDTARKLATALLDAAPPKALIVLSSDHWVAPAMYLQEVEKRRPDLVILATGLLSSSWHWDRIYRLHPDLAAFAIRGPGGRIGRVQRFLDQNRDRVVWIEEGSFALDARLSTCVGEFVLVARGTCDAKQNVRAEAFLRARVDALGDGEPSSVSALAQVSLQLAELAWRAGDPQRALRVLLAAVPSSYGDLSQPLPDVQNAPPLRANLPVWKEPKPLGDPAQNLYVAGQIALSVGAFEPAIRFIGLADQHGLSEASEWLSVMQMNEAR